MAAPKKPSKIKKDILFRTRMLCALFYLIGLVVLVRLVCVQFLSPTVRHNATALSERILTIDSIPARRGSILARNGEPLATSIFTYNAEFDFAAPGLDSLALFHEQSDSLAKLLAAFFKDKSAEDYKRMFRTEHARRYRLVNARDTTFYRSTSAWGRFWDRMKGEETVKRRISDTLRDHRGIAIFPRDVDMAEWEVLRTYPLLNWNMGMVYRRTETDRRVYPQSMLARRTVGLTGDQGNYGLELAYKDELTGTPGVEIRQRIARGFRGRIAGAKHKDPVDGYDVVTTLDVDMQDMADKVLRNRLESQNAIWGTTIVMEVETGEILAMVNLGSDGKGGYYERENYAVGRSMEPGSTFKLATVLTLLDDLGMSPSQTYQTNGGELTDVGPATGKKGIRDSHKGDYVISLRRAVSGSSNVYFAKAMWENYGATGKKQQYSDFLNKQLHLGETVGLERIGERKPSITTDWKVADPGMMLVKMAYGYRVRLAPIQMITFYNAIANGGRMISPVLVRELQRDGHTEERFKSRTITSSICSGSTLKIVRNCLEAVCTEGTAADFFRDTTRLRVAAKTGTAQVTNIKGNYLGSTVAYFPADKPRYTVLTTIETKQQSGKAYYGGPLAGPVVKQIVDYIFNRNPRAFGHTASQEGAEHHPSKIKGGDIEQIRRVADKFSPRSSFDSRTGWGQVRVDSLSNVAIAGIGDETSVMPDVRGMGLKDALFLLENRGLKVRFAGQGAVAEQSIPAGTRITHGTTASITLK